VSALLSAPTATFDAKNVDAHTGFALLEQPIVIAAASPVLAGGIPLAVKDASGTWLLDPSAAKLTFSYGALLYRVRTSGTIEIYDGANWTAEASFNPLLPSLKPVELALDPKSGSFTGMFVLSTVSDATDAAFQTAVTTHRPAYGFLTVFRTPRKAPVDANRSARGPSFGVISTANTTNVKPTPVQGLTPVSDMAKADGFAVFVKDGAGLPAADFLVSSNASLPATVTLRYYQGGVVRASVTMDPSGGVTLYSATHATIDAPIVNVTGELRARNVRYLPYGGGPERYL
jgi:hypothetical protein